MAKNQQASSRQGISAHPKTAPLRLNRDFWDDVGRRHAKGSVVFLDVTMAKRLIAADKAERVDPLPGERTE